MPKKVARSPAGLPCAVSASDILTLQLPSRHALTDDTDFALLQRAARQARFALAGVLALLAVACSDGGEEGPAPPAEDTRVTVTGGPVVGIRTEGGGKAWLGLPYAAPPVEDLRWRAPRPASGWSEERIANRHPSWCPQITTALDGLEDIEPGQILGDEDCLYLSVYAPGDAEPDSELPVMVWIHGGSNVWGRAQQYDPSALAETENVVVVVVQYRLGPLGFFTHDSLRDGSEGELDGAANFAILDLIEALGWVRENAAAFGGDSGNVTLFGESAGAQNIYALMVSPLSQGLFEKAIAQSGNPRSIPLDHAAEGHEGIANPFNKAATKMAGSANPTAGQLRALSAREVLSAYLSGTDREDTPVMIADGVTVPADGIRANLVASVKDRGIPLIMGSNREEAKYLLAFNPDFTTKKLGFIITPKDEDYYDAASDYLSKSWRAITLNDPAADLARSGAEDVYSFRFDWAGQGSFWLSDVSYLIGSSHMVEIPFIHGSFDNFLGTFGEMMFQGGDADTRTALSRDMMAYWGNFARTGSPGAGPSGVMWESLSPRRPAATILLDASDAKGIRMGSDTSTVESVLAELSTDPRLASDGRRCTVAEALSQIFGTTDARFLKAATTLCPGR